MRQQSDPTQELSPREKINAGIPTCKTLSKCANDNICNSPNFEFSNEQTDDQSSVQDDTSSLFQSQISTSYTNRIIINPMQNKQDDEKENNMKQNRIYDNLQKPHSAISKTSNNLQYEKNINAASDYNQLRKTVSTQSSNNHTNTTNNTTTNTNNNATTINNTIANKKTYNDKKIRDSNNIKSEQSPEDQTEILQQKRENRKSVQEDIRYKRKSNEFADAKESIVSNAHSSFLDNDVGVDRKFEHNKNKTEDKCMSFCSIF